MLCLFYEGNLYHIYTENGDLYWYIWFHAYRSQGIEERYTLHMVTAHFIHTDILQDRGILS